MKACTAIVLTLMLVINSSLLAIGQSKSPSPQDDNRLVIGASEVLLDVVVKDKKGKAVKDLSAADFEVSEDGVSQSIQSFRLHAGGEEAAEAQPKAPVSGQSPQTTASANVQTRRLTEPNVVAFVFDRLSPEARSRATKTALAYLANRSGGNDYIGIFISDLSLKVIQPYTNNPEELKKGFDKVAAYNPTDFTSNYPDIRKKRSIEAESSTAKLYSGLGATQGSGGTPRYRKFDEAIETNVESKSLYSLQAYEDLQRNEQGYATTNSLLAVANALRQVPGRKSLLFFSEGVSIPPAVQERFNSVISEANRANVSIYTFDAGGLRADSPQLETRLEQQSRTELRTAQIGTGDEGKYGPMTKDLERNEDMLRMNPQVGLSQLAAQTGGFMVADTNDLTTQLHRIAEDLHTYYLLTYNSTNKNYDGRFRQIAVKLKRSGLELQARKGYYAINLEMASPVLDYEAPVLGILDKATSASAFSLHTGGFSFPDAERESRTSILAELPSGAMTYELDKEKKSYQTNFSIVALVKDESGQVVRKLSQHYVLSGPASEIEAAKRGEVLFYREAELPPGRYTVVAAGYDALTGKASVSRRTFEVPASEGDEKTLRLSSLAVLKRVEKLAVPAGQAAGGNPFQYGEVQVYPNLGEPLHKSASKELAFFLTAYMAKGAKTPPQLTVELTQGNRSLGQAKLELPAPDGTGRIQFASALPLEGLKAGEYTLKATVDDGTSRVVRSEAFTLEE